MAAAASVAPRRLASGPDSQNAARIRSIGGGIPTVGPLLLSFHIAKAQKVVEGKEVTDNARAHQKS
eukprot:5632393-Pleurochrysis_carterae.AAC.1